MRCPTLALLALAACDPGAGFALVGGNGSHISWAVADDTVLGSVDAGAFTIDLSVHATLEAPVGVVLAADSAALNIHDKAGVPLEIEYFSDACQDAIPPAPTRSRRCILGLTNLHSTRYGRLDTITVQFGWATSKGQRVPLTARFARLR
jgi:hypothetical protein